jgi:hypothetical protein
LGKGPGNVRPFNFSNIAAEVPEVGYPRGKGVITAVNGTEEALTTAWIPLGYVKVPDVSGELIRQIKVTFAGFAPQTAGHIAHELGLPIGVKPQGRRFRFKGGKIILGWGRIFRRELLGRRLFGIGFGYYWLG